MKPKVTRHFLFSYFSVILIVVYCFGVQESFGQKTSLVTRIYFSAPPKAVLPEAEKLNFRNFNSLADLEHSLARLISEYQGQGFVTAGADSLKILGDTCHIWLFQGSGNEEVWISFSQQDAELMSSTGYPIGKPFRAEETGKHLQMAVHRLNDQGFPLATIRLSDSDNTNQIAVYQGVIKKGDYYQWDSIEIKGDGQISNRVLQKLLRIKKGDPYNRTSLSKVPAVIGTLPYLSLSGPQSVVLAENGTARLILPLTRVRASSFRGIIGFGPDQNDPERIRFSGDVNLKLVNALRYGEEMKLKWEGLLGDQQLELSYSQPYIPILPFGIQYSMDFLKKGDTYYRLDQRYGGMVPVSPGTELTLYVRQQDSRVLDRSVFVQAFVLPAWTDFRARGFGAVVGFVKLDFPLNPGKGGIIRADIIAGKKELLASSDIPEELLVGIIIQQRQVSGDLRLEGFIPLTPRWIIHSTALSKTIYSQILHENELFLLGGAGSLRGFEERSLRASSCIAVTAEIRYRFEAASHLRIFVDAGWYERRLQHSYTKDFPVGFGAGIAFNTAAGILQLDYAFGIQQGNAFDLSTGRLHLGIQTTF